MSDDDLFLNESEEEQKYPPMDPACELSKLSYELNNLSDLGLPADETSENRQQYDTSDMDDAPASEQETDKHAKIYIPPRAPDEQFKATIPPVPPAASGPAAPIHVKQGPGMGLATILGAVAILTAASAIWMSKDLSEQMAQMNDQQQTQPHKMDTLQNEEILALKQQLKAIEMQQERQIQVLGADVAAIKEQVKQSANVASLKTGAQKQAVTKPDPVENRAIVAIKPVAAKAVATSAPTGGWVVNLASLATETAARKEVERLHTKGIQAEYAQTIIKGKPWYRVRIAGLASKQEAQIQQERLINTFGMTGAWVGNQ